MYLPYQKSDLTKTFSLKNISLDKTILFEDIKILRGAANLWCMNSSS